MMPNIPADAWVTLVALAGALFGTLLGGVVWMVRLEGKVKALEKLSDSQASNLSLLQQKHENLDSRIVNELTRIRESLARMEGHIGFRSREGEG